MLNQLSELHDWSIATMLDLDVLLKGEIDASAAKAHFVRTFLIREA